MSELSSSSVTCDKRQIRLTRFEQEVYVDNLTTGFRLKIVADEACLMDAEIFRWFRGDPDLAGDRYDQFSGVCSAYEMHVLPKNEPEPDDCPQQFRLNEIDIVLPSQTLASTVWDLIVEEVRVLILSLNYSDDLKPAVQVLLGD